MKGKLKIVVPLVLVILGGGYKFAFAKSEEVPPKPKVHGEVYVLPKEFLVNLQDGRFAKVQIGLIIEHDEHAAEEGGGHGPGPDPPEGFGPNPQEGLVRDLITDELTGAPADALVDRHGREKLKEKILKRLKTSTDVHAEEVLITDVTVQ
jgi:flagellar basal body-associated protein FliL